MELSILAAPLYQSSLFNILLTAGDSFMHHDVCNRSKKLAVGGQANTD